MGQQHAALCTLYPLSLCHLQPLPLCILLHKNGNIKTPQQVFCKSQFGLDIDILPGK
jgi:hypothetical protein